MVQGATVTELTQTHNTRWLAHTCRTLLFVIKSAHFDRSFERLLTGEKRVTSMAAVGRIDSKTRSTPMAPVHSPIGTTIKDVRLEKEDH